MRAVVTLGDLVMDLIAPVSLPILAGQHQESGRLRPEPGGGCNFLIHAARLGLPVSAVGTVGDDPFGGELVRILREEGVDTRPVFVAPGSHSTIVLDLIDHAQKAHTFIGHASDGDPMPVTPLAETLIAEASAVFLQGYTLLEIQMQPPLPQLLSLATNAHVPVFYDVGPPTEYAGRDLLRLVLSHTHGLMTTQDELPLAADGLDGEAAFARLFEQGIRLIVVKRGPQGCLLVTSETRQEVPAYPVTVTDTVGAGDCFNAGFLYGYAQGWSLVECARLANASGGAAATKVGAGRQVPTRDDVQRLLTANAVALPGFHP